MEYNLKKGYITVDFEVSCINATFSEKREDITGVCQITEITIESDDSIPHEILERVQDELYNYFVDKEYFTRIPDWRLEIEEDISNYTGVPIVNVDLK